MTQDDDYAVAANIPGSEEFPPRWAAAARSYRSALGGHARVDISYGSGPRQVFDLFLPPGKPIGLTFFVHGGFWVGFDKSSWSHLAQGVVARGWACAMPSYDLCPDVRLTQISRQIAQAVQVAARDVDGPITLSGHSAGGHLVARMLAPGMLPEDVSGRISTVVPISPLSDLRPLLANAKNELLHLDTTEAEAESPVLQPAPEVPVSVWVGAEERPAFLDQARWLAEAWAAEHVVVPGKHHFDVIDALADPDSDLVARLTPE